MKNKTGPVPVGVALAVIIPLLICQTPRAQLTGRILDWQNQPVAACPVSLTERGDSIFTASSGAFSFPTTVSVVPDVSRKTDLRLRAGVWELHMPRAGDARFEAFDLRGHRIKFQTIQAARSGPVIFSLILEKESARPLAKSAALDSVWLNCPGFIPRKIPVTSYNLAMGDILVRPPNIIIVYVDDGGRSDIRPYGNPAYLTPNIDLMAQEGRVFHNFHVAQAVCSASRAALMTGCYSNRINLIGALQSTATIGIHDSEMTLAELVKQKGYATAIFGKWHLGRPQRFLPTHHGFDEYFGLPYSNDMWPYSNMSPYNPVTNSHPPLPLIQGDTVYDANVDATDQPNLTTWYTQRAVSFINRNRQRPFLLYVPHSMVHIPLFVSGAFQGRSGVGLFGDVMMEVDWSVGQIHAAVRNNGLDSVTLSILTSDNGPWLRYGNHAGLATPLREGKSTSFEGGTRVYSVMRWAGQVPAGSQSSVPAMTIDLFPTIASLMGGTLPRHTIDGKNIWPLISGQPGASSPHAAYYFYWGNALEGVRRGRWKYHFAHGYSHANQPAGMNGAVGSVTTLQLPESLFDLQTDPGEATNVITQNRALADTLRALGQAHETSLNNNKRPAGT